MTAPVWYFPVSGMTARSVAVSPYANGLVISDWTMPKLWRFAADHFLPTPFTLASGTPGIADVCSDGASGVWAVGYGGSIWHVTVAGVTTKTATITGAHVPVGAAFTSIPGFVTADGNVYSSSATLLGSFGTPAWFATASGGTLYSMLPSGTPKIGTFTLPGGVTGGIALPASLASPTCLGIAPGMPLAVGGWSSAAPLSGAVGFTLDPTDNTKMLGITPGTAILWSAPDVQSNNWTQTQALSGLSTLAAASWVPNGASILTCSPVTNIMQVLNYIAGVLSAGQVLSINGAASVAVATDSLTALVARSFFNTIQPIINTVGTWSVSGAAISGIAGLSSVITGGDSIAYAGCTAGIAVLNQIGGVWSLGTTIPLNFAPTQLAVDPFGNVFAAGVSGIAMASGTSMIASGTWSGAAPTGLVVDQGRYIVATPGDGILRVFGQSGPTTLSQMASSAISLGSSVALGLAQTTIFAGGSGATSMYGLSGAPYSLNPVRTGALAYWDGATWTGVPLGIGHTPSCIGYDVSGNCCVATVQNDLYTVSPGGSILTSGIVAPYTGQAAGVPLGMSDFVNFNGHMYVTTSLPGAMAQVS